MRLGGFHIYAVFFPAAKLSAPASSVEGRSAPSSCHIPANSAATRDDLNKSFTEGSLYGCPHNNHYLGVYIKAPDFLETPIYIKTRRLKVLPLA